MDSGHVWAVEHHDVADVPLRHMTLERRWRDAQFVAASTGVNNSIAASTGGASPSGGVGMRC
jgi:hypothetical protein